MKKQQILRVPESYMATDGTVFRSKYDMMLHEHSYQIQQAVVAKHSLWAKLKKAFLWLK